MSHHILYPRFRSGKFQLLPDNMCPHRTIVLEVLQEQELVAVNTQGFPRFQHESQ